MTLSTERLREKERGSERERDRERERVHLTSEEGRGERLSETSMGGVNSNYSSAIAPALLHTHDAHS